MSFNLLVGTYTRDTDSEGIYQYAMESDCSGHNLIYVNREIDNPSYLAKHPQLDIVYSVNEVGDFEHSASVPSGAITAFQHDAGKLITMNQQPTLGADPCHIAVDPDARFIIIANYSGGSLVSYALEVDGSLGGLQSKVQHSGRGKTKRQLDAHVHSTGIDKLNNQVYVADLGLDQLLTYPISEIGEITPNNVTPRAVNEGAGPRHFTTRGEFIYLFNELDSTIAVFKGEQQINLVSSLPENFTSHSDGAHIELSNDGSYIYVSNRGHDSIAVFKTDGSGGLTLLQHQSSGGKHPRHFCFSPCQQYLLVANRDTNNVVVFARNPENGLLTKSCEFQTPAPVYLLCID